MGPFLAQVGLIRLPRSSKTTNVASKKAYRGVNVVALWAISPARGAAGKAVDAYSEARHRERHADSAANAREWGRIATAVARLTGKRIGIDTGTRMAANADFTSEPKGRSFTISPILSGRRANRRIEAHSGGTMMRKRPPIVMCGTSILHWPREDGAPLFLGLPPATTPKQRAECAAVGQDFHEVVDRPVGLRLR